MTHKKTKDARLSSMLSTMETAEMFLARGYGNAAREMLRDAIVEERMDALKTEMSAISVEEMPRAACEPFCDGCKSRYIDGDMSWACSDEATCDEIAEMMAEVGR